MQSTGNMSSRYTAVNKFGAAKITALALHFRTVGNQVIKTSILCTKWHRARQIGEVKVSFVENEEAAVTEPIHNLRWDSPSNSVSGHIEPL